MKMRIAAALATLVPSALLPPLDAAAQTMDFACPDPGTVFTYDSGIKVVARGRDGMDCAMEIVGGMRYRLRALLFDNPAPDGRDMAAFVDALRPERLWPLQVGKKIEADYGAGDRSWHYILTVARHERRTGPRNALIDTFLIEMHEQGEGGERAISRWWISPADKFAIRFDYSDGRGHANRAVVTDVTR